MISVSLAFPSMEKEDQEEATVSFQSTISTWLD